jgi:hypothetical protein
MENKEKDYGKQKDEKVKKDLELFIKKKKIQNNALGKIIKKLNSHDTQ